MDRRSFLTRLIGGVAATGAVRTWPFRVFSFPSEIVIPEKPFVMANMVPKSVLDQLNDMTIRYFNPAVVDAVYSPSPMWKHFTTSGSGYGQIDPFRLRRG